MTAYADDIEFIFSEVARIDKMDPREALKQNSDLVSISAMLPHPSGHGQMLCGREAANRLRDIADLALSRSQDAGLIQPQLVQKKLEAIIVQRFLKEKRAINESEAAKAVSAAIKQAATAKADRTHFIPCHLGHSDTPNFFSIGPVRFQHQKQLIERLDPALQAYLDRTSGEQHDVIMSEDRRSLAEKLLGDTREHYASFGWVAEVTVAGCDQATSRQRAKRIVQNALDCLHLHLGAAYSHHMRAGGPSFSTDRRGRIEVNNDGDVEVSVSTDWLSHNLGDGWWEWINSEGGEQLTVLMGVAIDAGNDVQKPSPMSQRFLDGVAWYGEAVRDDFAASRLVKFVTAIERILTTKKQENLTDVLANRGAAMIFEPENDDIEVLRKRFRDIYDLRSRLIHGSRSPMEEGLGAGLRAADDLARSVLFRSLQFFRREGLEERTVNIKELDQAYDRLLLWADKVSTSCQR